MLGSTSEADDAVQEAWLRLARSGAGSVENLGGWLTTAAARACLNMPRSRRSGRPPGGDAPKGVEIDDDLPDLDDAWTETLALVDTVDVSELADPDVGVERLLFRLFHERGVRVFAPIAVLDDCSCSRERIREVLSGFSAEEIEDSIENGKIAVTCEFCSEHYTFEPSEFLGDRRLN